MVSDSTTDRSIRSKADLSHAIALELVETLQDKVERFSPADIALCTGALMDKLNVVPLYDTIFIDKKTGILYLDGKPVEDDQEQEQFIKMARDAKANRAADLVRRLSVQKVEYATIIMMRNASNEYDLVFAKAAMWALQQIDKVYEELLSLARPGDSPDDE
jgi:hypothetical protein